MRACLALALLAAACSGPQPLVWTYHFADPSLYSRASRVRATIFSGSCGAPASPDPVYDEEVPIGASGPPTPVLADGRYCFRGSAADSSCRAFASGEISVDLPLPNAGPIDIALAVSAETDACGGGACRCGSCRAEGCGAPDASLPDGG